MKAFIVTREGTNVAEGIEFSDGVSIVRDNNGSTLSFLSRDVAVAYLNGDGKQEFIFTEELTQ